MLILTGLLLTATLVAALPEPAKPAKGTCGNFRAHCTKQASRYCDKIIGTATETSIVRTSTVFDTTLPCATSPGQDVDNRAVTATGPPACLKTFSSQCGASAVTSACSKIGYTAASATTTVTAIATSSSTAFNIMFSDSGYNTYYADEAGYDTNDDQYTYFSKNRQMAYTLVPFGDGTCRIFEQYSGYLGNWATSGPAPDGTNLVNWQDNSVTDYVSYPPLQCSIDGQRLHCSYVDKQYYSLRKPDNLWLISSTGDPQNGFDAYVAPVLVPSGEGEG